MLLASLRRSGGKPPFRTRETGVLVWFIQSTKPDKKKPLKTNRLVVRKGGLPPLFCFTHIGLVLKNSRWQMHTFQQVCESRVGAQRVVNRIRFDLSHSIRALFKGLFQPDKRLVFVAESDVNPGDAQRQDILASFGSL